MTVQEGWAALVDRGARRGNWLYHSMQVFHVSNSVPTQDGRTEEGFASVRQISFES